MNPTRPIVLALALTFAFAAAAHAQVNLAWNNCITQANAAENLQYACNGSSNGTAFRLVGSFFPPNDLPEFVGIEMIVDVTVPSGSGSLPDWWRFHQSFATHDGDVLGGPECRDGNLFFPGSNSGIGTGASGACQNPWAGGLTGGSFNYVMNIDGNPGHARIRLVYARTTPFAAIGGQQYFCPPIEIDSYGDVATESGGICEGCCDPMLITLQRVSLYQEVPSQSGGDIHDLTTAATRNSVWWNPNGCGSNGTTPAHRSSWGAIKATYR